MEEHRLCYGCMRQTDYVRGICQRCGYNENVPVNETFIQPGTELNDKYIVGTALSMNGEGITYIALNSSSNCRVLLREYMPLNFCSRAENSPVICVNNSSLPQYKVLMEEFSDLNRSISQIREQIQVNRVIDMFSENNTAYVVYEYIDGLRFVDFLKENAGELSWGQLSSMLPSFLTTLSILHNSGVLHRAISPETIYVTKKCELELTDFSIAAARTANTELECEIFGGYAAPEQYSASNRQGTWTDVYAVCAVLYRVLTGSMPTSAISRMENDNLIAPCLLNPNISRHVSDVIMRGLNLISADRIQTITELMKQLFNEQNHGAIGGVRSRPAGSVSHNNPQKYKRDEYYDNSDEQYDDYNSSKEYADDYSYDSYGNESYQRGTYNEHQATAIDRVKVPLIIGMLLLVILLIVLYFTFLKGDSNETSDVKPQITATVTTSSKEEETKNTTPEGDGIMPNLVGKTYATQLDRYNSWMKFKVEEVYSDEYAAGQIVWQEIEEGQYFDTSVAVLIHVSKGPSKINLPDYINVYIGDYTKLLDQIGVVYKIEPETRSDYAANTVSRLSIDISELYDLESHNEITVYYAVAPIVTTEATTTPPPVTEPPVTVTEPPIITDLPVDPVDPVE
ncbi:MAG: protein kinase [Ruminococcus sp.]|nr:protein kinase [Ruminococcus sp.]